MYLHVYLCVYLSVLHHSLQLLQPAGDGQLLLVTAGCLQSSTCLLKTVSQSDSKIDNQTDRHLSFDVDSCAAQDFLGLLCELHLRLQERQFLLEATRCLFNLDEEHKLQLPVLIWFDDVSRVQRSHLL